MARLAADNAAAEERRMAERREAESAMAQAGDLLRETQAMLDERMRIMEQAEQALQAARANEAAMQRLKEDLETVCLQRSLISWP